MSALDSRGATQQRVAGGGSRADLNRLGRGSAANLVGAGVAALTTFALTVVVTRGVSKQDAGLFFAASSLFILASTLGQLGTPTGLVYFLAQPSLGHPGAHSAYVRTAVRPVIVGACSPALRSSSSPTRSLASSAPATPPRRPGSCGRSESSSRPPRSAPSTCRPPAVWAPCAPSVQLDQMMRPALQPLLVVAAVPLLGSGAIPWAGRCRTCRSPSWPYWPGTGWPPRATVSRHRRGRAGCAGVLALHRAPGPASVGQVVMQRLDIILVAAISGPVWAAIYTAATRFLVVGQMVNRALSTAVQPRLGEQLARNDFAGTNTCTARRRRG